MQKILQKVLIVLLCPVFLLAFTVTASTSCPIVFAANVDGMDSEFLSVKINGVPYVYGTSDPIALITDEFFSLEIIIKNTGETTWGKNVSAGEHGASLLSRGDPSTETEGKRPDDYNETFGTFFIIYPMQFGSLVGDNMAPNPNHPNGNPTVIPGHTWTLNTTLRAPSTMGNYTMRWQAVQWPIGSGNPPGYHITTTSTSRKNNPNNYFNRPFFGDELVADFKVLQRTEQPPPPPEHKKGILDMSDFEYQGSFKLPQVWKSADNGIYGHTDSKTYVKSGITLHKIYDNQGKVTETRMLAVTGSQQNTLYEVTIPETLGAIIGTSSTAVPTAELKTIFSGQSSLMVNSGGGSVGWSQGDMWLDPKTSTLYWTNYATYPSGGNLPSLNSTYWAKLDFESGEVYDRQGWRLPTDRGGSPFGAIMGGVTPFPQSFANEYLGGGTKLCIGFGGCDESIVSTRSMGPSLTAVSLDAGGNITDDYFNSFMYYPHNSNDNSNYCVRDGNYLTLKVWETNPASPWDGRWNDRDGIRTGVFIDYGGKKGYVTFVNQGIGRNSYDTAGSNTFAKYQQSWYFYDFETLGKAVNGEIPKTGITPSSYSLVNYPTTNTNIIMTNMQVSGSYFDNDTGLLYLYTRYADGDNPLVHVYKVTEGDTPTPTPTPPPTTKPKTNKLKIIIPAVFVGVTLAVFTVCIIASKRREKEKIQ